MDAWRSIICLSLSLGLIVLYRERFNRQGPMSRFLTRSSFGVYMFHAPILIAITMALSATPLPAEMKFAVAAILAVMASFLFVGLVVRRIPLMRAVI